MGKKKELYNFELSFEAFDGEPFGGFTYVENFGVNGGAARFIFPSGAHGIGDADLMSEFYQARQFNNIMITKRLNRTTLDIDRIYYQKLTFKFTFVVTNRSKSSRFRSLSLYAENGRILNPLSRNSHLEGFTITFSAPQIEYYYNDGGGKGVVKESL